MFGRIKRQIQFDTISSDIASHLGDLNMFELLFVFNIVDLP